MNAPPAAETLLQEGDGLLLVGSPRSIEEAKEAMGHEDPGRLSRDRANYDVDPGLCLEGGLRRKASAGSPAAGLSCDDLACAPGRHGNDRHVGSDHRIRRSPRGGRPDRQEGGGPAPFRRQHQGQCRIVLRVDRRRNRARPSARHDPGPSARRRHLQPRRRRRSARHGAGARLAWPHRADRMENARRREPGPAQSRPVDVHRIGRPRRGSALSCRPSLPTESRSSSAARPCCSPWC